MDPPISGKSHILRKGLLRRERGRAGGSTRAAADISGKHYMDPEDLSGATISQHKILHVHPSHDLALDPSWTFQCSPFLGLLFVLVRISVPEARQGTT